MDAGDDDTSWTGRTGWSGWTGGWSKPARQAWSARARDDSAAGSTPPICERCWYPVLPEHPVRSYHPQETDGPFAPLWRCFVHRDDCPEPRAVPEYRRAA